MTSTNSIPNAAQKVLTEHLNELYDACALLDAVEDRIDAATPSTKVNKEASESMHNTLRLVQMARERVQAACHAFVPLQEL